MIHVDTNVLIDVLNLHSAFHKRSFAALAKAVRGQGAGISQMVYAELAAGISDKTHLDRAVERFRVARLILSDEALFLAGRAYAAYRGRGGTRGSILPDFLIGAHAMSMKARLLTRDPKRYRTAFPKLALIEP